MAKHLQEGDHPACASVPGELTGGAFPVSLQWKQNQCLQEMKRIDNVLAAKNVTAT